MNKSQFAFMHTAEMMFERGPVYFWTFTWRRVHPDWNYSFLWNSFLRELLNWTWGNVGGVRVVEAHRQHGLHYHVLVNRRLPIRAVRRMAEKCGIFWVDVRQADTGAINYLVPYLRKTWREADPIHCSMRRWSKFGSLPCVKVRNVECDSPTVRVIKRAKLALNEAKLSYGQILAITSACKLGLDYEAVFDKVFAKGQNDPF